MMTSERKHSASATCKGGLWLVMAYRTKQAGRQAGRKAGSFRCDDGADVGVCHTASTPRFVTRCFHTQVLSPCTHTLVAHT
eukprot:363934-Chlamydomonas_euryale.AAC.7